MVEDRERHYIMTSHRNEQVREQIINRAVSYMNEDLFRVENSRYMKKPATPKELWREAFQTMREAAREMEYIDDSAFGYNPNAIGLGE